MEQKTDCVEKSCNTKKRKTGGFQKGTALNGIRSLQGIKDRCVINQETNCWRWSLSKSKTGAPRATVLMPWANDAKTVHAMRAAYEYKTGTPVKNGYRVWAKCGDKHCCNPDHADSGSVAQWGAFLAERGVWKGQPARVLANREIVKKRRSLTNEQVEQIRLSVLPLADLSLQYGVSRQTISAIRTYQRYTDQVMRGASIFSMGFAA